MECKLKNITVQYEEHGKGIPIIMLHGFSADRLLMIGCMEPIFKDRNEYRRIYLDLPGMGKTIGEKWIDTTDKMLQAVLDFIDNVIPNEKFLLVGESYGGYLARGIVYKRPQCVNGLLLISPVIVATHSKRVVPEKVILYKDEELLSSLSNEERDDFKSMNTVLSKEVWKRYNEEIFKPVKLANNSFLRFIMFKGYDFSFDVDNLEKPFEKPTTFIIGHQDNVVGYKDSFRILDNYTRASFIVLDRAGHNIQLEQVNLFNQIVNEWIFRVEEYFGL